MSLTADPALLTLAAHVLIVATISVRVIMSRPATGVGLLWLLLISVVPFAGGFIYLLVGERRVGLGRARKIARLRGDYAQLVDAAIRSDLTRVDWSRHVAGARSIDRLGRRSMGSPTLCGSHLELSSDTIEILRAIARDVDAAQSTVLMEFYIWAEGGAADEVLEALIRAARRGVSCRVLVDAVGGRPWWKGDQPERLRHAGVRVLPALPLGLIRAFIGRTDLRLHRKIVVVDGTIAWTGSMNMVDPRHFKQDEGFGEWIDAMVRVEGAAVVGLAATVIWDWCLETGEPIEKLIGEGHLRLIEPKGSADIQIFPSGPIETQDGLVQMLLALINTAERDLVLTTPYFVPDEPILRALRGAAGRGVTVTLIVPEKVDSFLTRHASRSYYDDLLGMGVNIRLFYGGLLHTKSISVDGAICMFGTVNLDYRSLWLNYEVALFVYDTAFTEALQRLQLSYVEASRNLDRTEWLARPFGQRLLENTLRLASPVL